MIQLSISLFDDSIINVYSRNSKFIGFYNYEDKFFIPNSCEEFNEIIENINYDEFVSIVYNVCNNFLNKK